MVITDNRASLDPSRLRATLVPEGALDAGSVEEFASTVQDAIRDGAHELDVDLAAVPTIDADVVRVLAHARETLETWGGHLCLRNASPSVEALLDGPTC